jgi:hypothetical protein
MSKDTQQRSLTPEDAKVLGETLGRIALVLWP